MRNQTGVVQTLCHIAAQSTHYGEQRAAWTKLRSLMRQHNIQWEQLNKSARDAFDTVARVFEPDLAKHDAYKWAPPPPPHTHKDRVNPNGTTQPRDRQGRRSYTTRPKDAPIRHVKDQVEWITCTWCGKEVEVVHYPGNSPKFCSPECRHYVQREQARQRMARKRAKS
jgi:predicted nucleic acid-binding Zn ribbon protein